MYLSFQLEQLNDLLKTLNFPSLHMHANNFIAQLTLLPFDKCLYLFLMCNIH